MPKSTVKKTASTKKTTKRTRKSASDAESSADAGVKKSAADASSEEKPKRKRTVKKKTAAKKADSDASSNGDGFAAGLLDDGDSGRATKSVKKKATRKKATAKKRTTQSETADSDSAEKPKKTRVAKKTSAESDGDEQGSRPPRTRRKKSSESADDSRSESKRRSDFDSDSGREDSSRNDSDQRERRSSQSKTRSSRSSGETRSSSDTRSSSGGNSDDNEGGRRRRRRRRGGKRNRNDSNSRNEGGRDRQSSRGGNNNGGGRGNRGGRGRARTRPPAHNDEVTGEIEGVLELHPNGYGFLRDPNKNYATQDDDAFVSSSFVEKYKLREGVLLKGDVGPGGRNKGPRIKGVHTIDGRTPEEYAEIADFDDLTPITPYQQIKLELGSLSMTTRVIDLVAPIGKGQRSLIVAPPRSGKTMLIQSIAEAISINHPEVHLMMLLIDERPEEVTEMRRQVDGEVIASSMDQEIESHVRVSQLIFERAKRLAETGKDVVILFDSITRTARAFNKRTHSGATGSGGVGVKALEIPRKQFGTARQFEEGGSLTVIATALIDTGSRADDVIFQEFKGTGNMELMLSRELADRRIWPAVNIRMSGTRREEKLLSPETLEGVTLMRRSLASLQPVEAMQQLTETLKRFKTNEEFLEKIQKML